jgi:aminomethyltransferase
VSEFLPDEIGPGPDSEELRTTPLDALHRRLGARMVPFAGYDMPVQYPAGIIAEHLHCRSQAALFDVSHMGQVRLSGDGVAAALERLVPGDITGLKPGRQRYSLFLNEAGGILDDLMAANHGDRLELVVNASRKDADIRHLRASLPGGIEVHEHEDRALLALQGPQAAAVLGRLAPEAAALPFMAIAAGDVGGIPCWLSRSGYTGEDGFEISVPAADAVALAERLLAEPEVAPAGLGARDTLRLEAGLCLYGNDIDELTSPVEAGLVWTIGKRRRMAWDFPGAEPIRDALDHGPHRRRVGLRLDGRAAARTQTLLVAADGTGAGTVTSGGFAPSLNASIAMAYLRRDLAADGTQVFAAVRGRNLPATVVPMPFVPHRYRI